MKKVLSLVLAVLLLVTALAGCGGSGEPAYEYLVSTESTVESARFDFCFAVPENFFALTSDFLEMVNDDVLSDLFGGEPEQLFAEGEAEIGGEKYPLMKIVMLTDFESGQYITFKVAETGAATPEDYFAEYESSLPEGTTAGEPKEIRLSGLPGYSVELHQDFGGTAFENQIYFVLNNGYVLIINCSGAGSNDAAVNAVEEQLIRAA